MKKDWEPPKLEVLDVNQTMKGFDPPWNWDLPWKGRSGGGDDDEGGLLGS